MITDTAQKVVSPGDGANDTFPFSFKIIDASDVKLYKIETDGSRTTISSNFTTTPNADQETSPGGSVKYPNTGTKLQTGESLVLLRETPETQEKDLTTTGDFAAEDLEAAVDKLTAQVQDHDEELGRTAIFPVEESPTYAQRSSYLTDVQTAASAAAASAASASASASAASASASAASASASAASASAAAASTSQTNAETAETGAVAAQAAAVAAQAAAETAQTNAETAQAAAETAQTNAETAQTNAETAQTNAETAQTNAETAQTNAETAQAAAETAQAAAETAETNAAASAAAAAASTFAVLSGLQVDRPAAPAVFTYYWGTDSEVLSKYVPVTGRWFLEG